MKLIPAQLVSNDRNSRENCFSHALLSFLTRYTSHNFPSNTPVSMWRGCHYRRMSTKDCQASESFEGRLTHGLSGFQLDVMAADLFDQCDPPAQHQLNLLMQSGLRAKTSNETWGCKLIFTGLQTHNMFYRRQKLETPVITPTAAEILVNVIISAVLSLSVCSP